MSATRHLRCAALLFVCGAVLLTLTGEAPRAGAGGKAKKPAAKAKAQPAKVQQAEAGSAKKYALLVGCTEYPIAKLSALAGPANDAALMADLLTKHFGFAEANI